MQFAPLELIVTRIQLREFDEVVRNVIDRTIAQASWFGVTMSRKDAIGRFRDDASGCLVISLSSSYKPFFGTRFGFNPEEVRIEIEPVPRLLEKAIPHLERYDEYQRSRLKGGRYFLNATGVYRKDRDVQLNVVVKWHLPEVSEYF